MRKARVKRPRTRPGDRRLFCHAPGSGPSTGSGSRRVVHRLSALTSPPVLRFLLTLLMTAACTVPAAAITVVGDDVADEYVISGAAFLNASTPAAQEAAGCTGCHWRVVRICAAGSLDERRGCDQLPYPCDADRAEVWRADAPTLPPVGDPLWEYRGLMCLDGAPVPVASVQAVVPDLARQAVPALRPGSAPGPATLTNLRTAFSSGQQTDDPPQVLVNGARVQLHLHPRWTWNFGHGNPLVTTHAGTATATSAVAHVYPRRGIYRVVVSSAWNATYDVNGIAGPPVAETIRQSAWFDIRVKEARRYSTITRSNT